LNLYDEIEILLPTIDRLGGCQENAKKKVITLFPENEGVWSASRGSGFTIFI